MLNKLSALHGFQWWLYPLSAVPANAATVTVSPNVGPPTTPTVTGAGFAANAIMDVYFDLTQVAFQATNASGGFSLPRLRPLPPFPDRTRSLCFRISAPARRRRMLYVIRTNWPTCAAPRAQAGTRRKTPATQGTVDNLVNVWNVRPGVGVYAAPIVAGLNVYFVSGDGHLRAHNRTTGVQVFDIAAMPMSSRRQSMAPD